MSLKFFQDLGGIIVFDIDDAQQLTARMDPYVYTHDDDEFFRDLTDDEYDMVVLSQPSIRLKGEAGVVVEHQAPNGSHFTVRELLDAVVETERKTRLKSKWIGGPDFHHVYFEGIFPNKNGTWRICWGS